MPRRSSCPTTTLSTRETSSLTPSRSPPDNITVLRTQWKWAAFGQFFYTFNDVLAVNNFSLEDIENDLTYGTTVVLPQVMQRLLYILSYDRKVSLDNWQTVLRKQYNKRDPLANPIGSEPAQLSRGSRLSSIAVEGEDASVAVKEDVQGADYTRDSLPRASVPPPWPAVDKASSSEQAEEPAQQNNVQNFNELAKDWLDLPMLVKLDSMHLLVEWQFQNPMRLRNLMKFDDEGATWRTEPVGYDSKQNTYWLIGGNRLWIQRAPPKTGNSLKRKRTNNKPVQSKATERTSPAKRPRTHPHSGNPSTEAQNGRGSRAAKMQAKLKLDAQAKELAELNKQASKSSTTRPQRSLTVEEHKVSATRPSRSVGTRASARLKGAQQDGWQHVPEEWLLSGGEETVDTKEEKVVRLKTGLESDDDSVSDLTELSDDVEDATTAAKPIRSLELDTESSTPEPTLQNIPEVPEDFVEWETLCVTLFEWEHIAERFENSKHYTEKAFHKVLVNDIVPLVTAELREIEEKSRMEEAIVHRKRSSRIATKESVREEARLAAKRRAEEAEKMSRAKRLEARLLKEEEERFRRETARELRRKEREGVQHTELPKPQNEVDTANGASVVGPSTSVAGKGSKSGSRTPVGEEWELDCEICQRRGVNLDDGTPMMSCESCAKWQHILCHDKADRAAGRRRRDWDAVEFICEKCRRAKIPENPSETRRSHPQNFSFSTSIRAGNSYNSQQPTFGGRSYNSDSYPTSSPLPSTFSTPMPAVQPSNPTIAFSHYQPQERGFSSDSSKPGAYPAPYHLYGQPRTQHQYSDFRTNNHKSQVAAATQQLWSITTPVHPPHYPPQNSPSGSANSYGFVMQQPGNNQPWEMRPPAPAPTTQFATTPLRYYPTPYQPPSN